MSVESEGKGENNRQADSSEDGEDEKKQMSRLTRLPNHSLERRGMPCSTH